MKKVVIGAWIYVLMSIMLMGCSASRKTQSDTEQKVKIDASSKGTEQGNRAMVQKMMKQYEELLNIVTDKEVEQVRTELSAPDSTGVQYPTAVTRTNVKTKTTADQNRKEQTDSNTKAVEAKTVTRQDTLSETLDESTITTDEVKRSLSWWQSALIFLGVALIVYIGFKVYLKIKKT